MRPMGSRDYVGTHGSSPLRTTIISLQRTEANRGFSRWHEAKHGEPVDVAWSKPGGTSEISKMLIASTEAALRDDRPIGGNADLLFGGGSY